jgi:hypothetical protein
MPSFFTRSSLMAPIASSQDGVSLQNGKTRFMCTEEEVRLLAPWGSLALLTGMRVSEQFKLLWADVDLERGLVTRGTA